MVGIPSGRCPAAWLRDHHPSAPAAAGSVPSATPPCSSPSHRSTPYASICVERLPVHSRRTAVLLGERVGVGQDVLPLHLVVQGVEPVRRLLLGLRVQLPLEPPELSRGLPGSRQSPAPPLVRAHPEPGPLPSTGITRLPRYYGPLRRLPRPSPDADRAGSPRPPRQVSRVASHRCVRAAPTTPASRAIFIGRFLRSPPAAFVQ